MNEYLDTLTYLLFLQLMMGDRVVCVTGASGFIASWVVKLLLHHGYTVRVTVRDTADPEKTHHLLQLDGAKERLQIFRADLLEQGSFDSIVSGCQGVVHTASPVIINPNNPKIELIDPAVTGTLNVLASCAKFPSIKRVVITSSIVSLLFNRKPLTSDVVVDESWFSDPNFCQESKLWYVLSKTLAEAAAYQYAKEKGIDLVTLHPGFVIGPLLQPRLNLSSELFLNLVQGAENLPAFHRFVDVRDVAEAHVQALETPSATGRYCLVAKVVTTGQVCNLLRKLVPSLLSTHQCEDEEAPYEISKERANKGLGIDFISWEQSVKDTVKSLKDKNYLIITMEEQN